MLPNTDYTQLIDTGNYVLSDSIEMGYYPQYYNTSFYGRKENDSMYYGCTLPEGINNLSDSEAKIGQHATELQKVYPRCPLDKPEVISIKSGASIL